MMQHVAIVIILIAAVAYAGWRIVQAVRHANDPCYGCDGCALKEMKQQRRRQCPARTPSTKDKAKNGNARSSDDQVVVNS